MKARFHVHAVAPTSVEMEVALPDGSFAQASVPGVEVVLTHVRHGSLTLRLTGEQAQAHPFVAGEGVELDFAPITPE